VDLTPHLVTGAAIGARVRVPVAALLVALVSHFILDATPHFDIVWIGRHRLLEAIDIGLGFLLIGVIIWRVRHWWPLAGALAAVLPDAPGVKERWDTIFPHYTWAPPGGIAVEIVVAGAMLLWGIGGRIRTK
jgi:hypothetical protein